MGKLLDLLKASAGERNTRNALGRWRQAVSKQLDNGGGGFLANAGVKMASNAAPAAPAPAATAPIFAPLEEISVTTTAVNEVIRITLNVDRLNAGPIGDGTYRATVNGVPVGPARNSDGTAGPNGLTIIDFLLTIAAPGVYAIGAQVTSNGAVETVNGGARLIVQANTFT